MKIYKMAAIALAILASGSATNAQNLLQYFSKNRKAEINISCLLTHNPKSGLVALSLQYKIPLILCTHQDLQNDIALLNHLQYFNIDYIILAGFLRKIPEVWIQNFPQRIINIHPSLLPKFGGRGMYGLNVHKSVLMAKESITGFTVHYVNQQYDEGEIIAQQTLKVSDNDTPESLQEKVKHLEHSYFPMILENLFFQQHQLKTDKGEP